MKWRTQHLQPKKGEKTGGAALRRVFEVEEALQRRVQERSNYQLCLPWPHIFNATFYTVILKGKLSGETAG